MPKNIVVLLDGTGNQFGDKNTDLIRLKSVLSESEEDQMVYYSSGLGEAVSRIKSFSVPGKCR